MWNITIWNPCADCIIKYNKQKKYDNHIFHTDFLNIQYGLVERREWLFVYEVLYSYTMFIFIFNVCIVKCYWFFSEKTIVMGYTKHVLFECMHHTKGNHLHVMIS
jgi:hypothetical protein